MPSSQTPAQPLDKTYSSSPVEEKWSGIWSRKKIFHARTNSAKPAFAMMIPPPNVTGILHMGHALNDTLQDIIARYKRMRGYEVLWMPGTDHAGIATQNVVERSLKKQGMDRRTLGREKFLEHVWQWREKYGNTILEQLKRMGCSCDWDRVRFTMDEGLSRAVREVFVRLYQKGLIYKGSYITNWCPRCETALSDEEVTHKEINGHLYHIRYAIENSGDSVVIATTRPETLLGDTAIGVNPQDERYRGLAGKTAILPVLGRKLRIIQDEIIDPRFGTGVLKITPSHDPVDFDLGKKHHLPFINILKTNGSLNENAGPYRDLDRFEARKRIIHDLEAQGVLLKIEDHFHAVGHCYRCHTLVEPVSSPQWFVRMKPLAEDALRAAQNGEIVFYPKRWTKVYLEWLTNIRDWCISRQIWWGHRIPVWTCQDCPPAGPDEAAGGPFIVSSETPHSCPRCGSKNLKQDEDVLDTWFSSWLWPFTTLGWPDKTPELERFYPTQTLITGYEIIFFWVARMIMAGYAFTGQKPFKDIYIHGIVRDAEGAKMSKSSGNAVDPLDIIKEFGADALRFSIISITSEGQDVFASREKFETGRNFANKVWNSARFVLMNLKSLTPPKPDARGFANEDRWILSRLSHLVNDATDALEQYRFNETAASLYEFFWHEFCDWYLEIAKSRISDPACQWTLGEVLSTVLKLLHPFMPFITEELWQKLHPESQETLELEEWPKAHGELLDPDLEGEFASLIRLVQDLRNVRSTWQISPKTPLQVFVACGDGRHEPPFLKKYSSVLVHMARLEPLRIGPRADRPKQSVLASSGDLETYVALGGIVDIAAEKKRMASALDEIDRLLEGVGKKIRNSDFAAKAPPEVVQKEKARFQEFEERKKKILSNLSALTD